MEPASGIVLLLLGAGGLGMFGMYRSKRRTLEAEASELGLDVRRDLGVEGTVDGFDLRLGQDPNSDVGPSRTVLTLGFGLPAGTVVRVRRGLIAHVDDLVKGPDIQLGNDLDPRLTIRGRAADLRPLLLDPAVEVAIRAILDAEGWFLLDQDELHVVDGGTTWIGDLAPRVERAVALARAIRAVWVQPWEKLKAKYGLRDESSEVGKRLAGAVDGVPVVVQQHRHDKTHIVLRVTAQLRRPLPNGTELVHIDRGTGRSAPLSDPILAGQLHVRADDVGELDARLSRDVVRGPLLEVVHGFPGSTVTAERIGLLVPDAPLDPTAALELVLELEAALGSG